MLTACVEIRLPYLQPLKTSEKPVENSFSAIFDVQLTHEFWRGGTINKAMKFSHMAPVCGGPVEIAVITTDRKFRWVRHKKFDAAIGEGGLFDVYRNQR